MIGPYDISRNLVIMSPSQRRVFSAWIPLHLQSYDDEINDSRECCAVHGRKIEEVVSKTQ